MNGSAFQQCSLNAPSPVAGRQRRRSAHVASSTCTRFRYIGRHYQHDHRAPSEEIVIRGTPWASGTASGQPPAVPTRADSYLARRLFQFRVVQWTQRRSAHVSLAPRLAYYDVAHPMYRVAKPPNIRHATATICQPLQWHHRPRSSSQNTCVIHHSLIPFSQFWSRSEPDCFSTHSAVSRHPALYVLLTWRRRRTEGHNLRRL